MITIKNFDKLDNQEFEVLNTKFIIELYTDPNNPVGSEQEIWLYPIANMNYVLLMHPDFVKQRIKIRRCILGEGKDGDDLEDTKLYKSHLETMEDFKEFIATKTYTLFDKLK